MKIYIRGTGIISPQQTFDAGSFLAEPIEYIGDRLTCAEPSYKELIDVKLIRRMSRVIKMGVAAAMQCLKEAGVPIPDAIVTGTAYGCLEDTGVFLTKLVENNEEVYSPTAFIQSTHNTVGGQIALLLQCTKYNNTFAHRAGSFESALLDAIMLLEEQDAENVLVGGIDEITDISHAILTRMGLYKREVISNLNLFNSNTKGTIAGEGASFFLLANEPSPNDYAELSGMTTFYKPVDLDETEQHIASFLAEQSVSIDDIDLVITGKNGDIRNDETFNLLQSSIFKNSTCVNYKHLCGEYPTAISFALWMGASIIKTNTIPAVLGDQKKPEQLKKVLIYNHYQNTHHSLILISAC